jgi:hypothetical protein
LRRRAIASRWISRKCYSKASSSRAPTEAKKRPLPYLTGKEAGSPHNVLLWRRLPLFAIRDGHWKLWESVNDKTGQYGQCKLLFNLQDDLNETTNLASHDRQKIEKLEKILHQWAKTLSAPKWPSKKPITFNVCGRRFTLPI